MKTIIIKTQEELDALPDSFEEFTEIQIHGGTLENRIVIRKKWGSASVRAYNRASVVAYDSASVRAYGSASVVAYDSASVEAHDSASVVAYGSASVVAYDSASVVAHDSASVRAYNSASVEAYNSASVEAFEFSMIAVFTASVVLKRVCDYAMVSLRGVNPTIQNIDKTATIKENPSTLNISFETWLERGYVYADGIMQKLISRKKQGEVEVFTVESFPQKKQSYVVKRGDTFSHGETVEKVIEGLRYKLSDRDTSRFKNWNLSTEVSVEDAIQSYRAITGACEYGVRSFCESISIPENLTVKKVIELTAGKYGHIEYSAFFNEGKK